MICPARGSFLTPAQVCSAFCASFITVCNQNKRVVIAIWSNFTPRENWKSAASFQGSSTRYTGFCVKVCCGFASAVWRTVPMKSHFSPGYVVGNVIGQKARSNRANSFRQPVGNRLHCMHKEHISNTRDILLAVTHSPPRKWWEKLNCEWIFLLEIAWNYLPVNCLVWQGPYHQL